MYCTSIVPNNFSFVYSIYKRFWIFSLAFPGPVTVSLLQDHDCLKKECPFLQKNELSPYWEKLEQEKRQKELKKIKRQSLKR